MMKPRRARRKIYLLAIGLINQKEGQSICGTGYGVRPGRFMLPLMVIRQTIQTMKANSSVFRRPLAKSVHLQPKKTHNGSSKLLACSIHEFQFNLPNCSIPITLRNIYSSPSPLPSEYPDGRPCEPLEDCRKQLIKQKIKFRVKQEMWNLMRKNYEKPAPMDASYYQNAKEFPNPQAQTHCLKGASIVRANRANITFEKKYESSQRMFSASFLKDNTKELDNAKGKGHRRVWSSFVKMKEKDRVELQRTRSRASVSSFNIEKLDAYKIEPWKGFEDQENLYEQR